MTTSEGVVFFMTYAIIIILLILQAVREYFVQKERANLLDRIMTRSYTEFKDNEKPEDNHLDVEDDGTQDLDSAKDEIVYGKEEE